MALAYIFEELFLIAKKITKEALLGFFDEDNTFIGKKANEGVHWSIEREE